MKLDKTFNEVWNFEEHFEDFQIDDNRVGTLIVQGRIFVADDECDNEIEIFDSRVGNEYFYDLDISYELAILDNFYKQRHND